MTSKRSSHLPCALHVENTPKTRLFVLFIISKRSIQIRSMCKGKKSALPGNLNTIFTLFLLANQCRILRTKPTYMYYLHAFTFSFTFA